MAIVNWPVSFIDKFNQSTGIWEYRGFDFRDIFTKGLENASASTDANTVEAYGEAYGFVTDDKYTGDFNIVEEVIIIAPGVTVTQTEIIGTIKSMTRSNFIAEDERVTIKGLQIDYEDAVSAAKTPGKSDDMALWAKAFAGNDVFRGSPVGDRLEGFAGNDNLTGRVGADKLFGGLGRDAFVFTSIKDSTVKAAGRDIVYDFSHSQKDKLDLKAIDASTKTTGNQAFKYIGSQDFHKKAGELRWEKVTGGVAVHGDVNGDGKADFSITLRQITKIDKGDFLL